MFSHLLSIYINSFLNCNSFSLWSPPWRLEHLIFLHIDKFRLTKLLKVSILVPEVVCRIFTLEAGYLIKDWQVDIVKLRMELSIDLFD